MAGKPSEGRRIGRFRSPAAESRFLAAYDRALGSWPTAPEQLDVDTRYGPTHVLSCGGSTGVPIVLLPAIAVSAASWFGNVAALGAHHPVLAIDTIGDVGRSKQTTPIRDASELASWLDELLRELGARRVHLVGLSYGGWVALNQAVRVPDRIASVTSVDPPGAILRPRAKLMIQIAPDAILATVGKSDRALIRMLRLLNNGSVPTQPLLDLSVAGLRTFRGKQPPPRRLTDAQLSSIRIPTLVLFGSHSPLTNSARAAERLRHLVADVEVEVVPEGGHMLPVEKSDLFNHRVLQFIDAVDGVRDADT